LRVQPREPRRHAPPGVATDVMLEDGPAHACGMLDPSGRLGRISTAPVSSVRGESPELISQANRRPRGEQSKRLVESQRGQDFTEEATSISPSRATPGRFWRGASAPARAAPRSARADAPGFWSERPAILPGTTRRLLLPPGSRAALPSRPGRADKFRLHQDSAAIFSPLIREVTLYTVGSR
jgi:hypothetical protein